MLNNKYDEGLGTVYERIMLNKMFDKIIDEYHPRFILETPIFGMTGLTGINSVQFARRECHVTLCDTSHPLELARDLWQKLNLPINTVEVASLSKTITLTSNTFDLVWNFAALWHIANAPNLIGEMTRLSKNLVLIFVQNKTQIGYLLRKYVIDKKLFATVHEEWLNTYMIKRTLLSNNFYILKEGIIDVPPFPDVAMPVGRKVKSDWSWNVMDYYMGKDDGLLTRLEKYQFIENSNLPFKKFWSHHRFILAQQRS